MADIDIKEQVKQGDQLEVQLAPPGSYNQLVDDDEAEGGKKVITQLVDQDAIERLVSNFKDDVLVDADHDSENGKGTEAMAWVKALKADPDRGLVAVFEFTDVGADAVNGKRYRFVSPAWTMGQDGRPEKLVSVGMTNKPNLPVAPVLNMRVPETQAESAGSVIASAGPEGEAAANAVEGETPSPDGTETKKGPNMDKIKEILGLALEATDEDVIAAVEALVAQVAEMEQAKNEAEAEEFAEENKDKVEDKEVLKNCFLKDREMAKAIVANCRVTVVNQVAAPAPAPVVNCEKAQEPEVVKNSVREGMIACKTPEEMNAYIAANAAALVK